MSPEEIAKVRADLDRAHRMSCSDPDDPARRTLCADGRDAIDALAPADPSPTVEQVIREALAAHMEPEVEHVVLDGEWWIRCACGEKDRWHDISREGGPAWFDRHLSKALSKALGDAGLLHRAGGAA